MGDPGYNNNNKRKKGCIYMHLIEHVKNILSMKTDKTGDRVIISRGVFRLLGGLSSAANIGELTTGQR